MNTGLIALVIAAIFGALAMTLFRSPRRDPEAQTPPIEKVVPTGAATTGVPVAVPTSPETPPLDPIMPIEAGTPDATSQAIDLAAGDRALPTEGSAATADAVTLSDASSPDASSPDASALVSLSEVTYGEVTPLAAPPVEIRLDSPDSSAGTPTLMASGFGATPAFTRGPAEEQVVAPIAAIHDPKRPSTPALQDLSQDILAWGNAQQLSQIPKLLPYANHGDSTIRAYVALALGKIAAPHTVKREIEQVIPVLGKLTQDADPQVRRFAVQALGGIASPQVLPYLEQALRSPSGSVMQAANTALQKLNLKPPVQAATLNQANPPQFK